MNPERELAVLKKKRSVYKGQLTNFKRYVESFADNADYTMLRTKLARMVHQFTEVQVVQTDIECLDLETDYSGERAELENEFDNWACRAKDLLKSENVGTASAGSAATRNTGVTNADGDVRLPQIALPSFSGAYDDWPGFADQFISAVHTSNTISDGKKLTYLRSCLKGEAARTIGSLGNSANNYAVAWALLRKRFDQPSIVANKHIGALLGTSASSGSGQRDLCKFVTDAEAHYEALRTLHYLTVDNILIYVLTSQLDAETVEKWKESKQADFPTVEELLEFLHERCKIKTPSNHDLGPRQTRAKSNANSRISTAAAPRQAVPREAVRHAFATQHPTPRCALCKSQHYTSSCDNLNKLQVTDRLSLVKQARLCVNCLRPGHSVTDCMATKCKRCHKPHHTLLHIEHDVKQPQDGGKSSANSEEAPSSSVACLNATIPSEVLLFTAVILIHDDKGQSRPCRVLLDSCSQTNFLTEGMAQRLNLPRQNIDIPLHGINQMQSRVKHFVRTTMHSRHNDYAEELTFLIVPRIADRLPNRQFSGTLLSIPKNINLADPNYYKPADIDGLLGAELFSKLLCIGQIKLDNSRCILQKTLLGWVISGSPTSVAVPTQARCHLTTANELDSHLTKFWEIEERVTPRILSPDETACEQDYARNTTRDSTTGRYVVALPFRENAPVFEESYAIALRRLHALERSLARNPSLRSGYADFLREYEQLGHMSEIDSANLADGYFIPHLPVQKASSLTTKLRVVFDASASAANGVALNDTLLTGPTIQEDIFSLITRFRSHAYVLTADIAKMYRQILVRPGDRKYQRILWRETSTEPVKIFELNTVTYGTSCAPFLATRTLFQLAIDESQLHADTALTVQTDFYVDDLLTGSDSIESTFKLRNELLEITKKGGFHLRQWASNEPSLTADLSNRSDNTHLCLDTDKTQKTLGVYWNTRLDTIAYSTHNASRPQRVTKRTVLSEIAQLYDPLGLMAPVIVRAKILMQHLWQLKLGWDESVPSSVSSAWCEQSEQMSVLEAIEIPRKIVIDRPASVQLHGFCDASERAYGACIYLRSMDADHNVCVQLVCSKTRVAPLKSISLPRLELCAAALLCKLFVAVRRALRREFDDAVFWSDSTITLQWIRTPPHTLKTFVSNRVAEIQRISAPHQWKHVPSKENPADLLSRGLTPVDFVRQQALWQNGPTWLSEPADRWPRTVLQYRDVPDIRGVTSLTVTIQQNELLQSCSSLSRLKRIVAYCLRFKHNAQNKSARITGPVSVGELQAALNRVLILTQREGFSAEIDALKRNPASQNASKSKLSALAPFFDENDIIRVGGRLAHSDLPYKQKFPVVLPSSHHVTKLIISNAHSTHYHAGSQATLNAVRQDYWPVHGKAAVKAVIGGCVVCRRARPIAIDYKMGDLPLNRVTYKRPFLVSGVDYCGPLYIKERRHRNVGRIKVYIAVFVCFVTRAVHLEIVEDLTSEAFLAAVRRFFARRGRSTDLYSDNASTFVGAHREMREIYETLRSEKHQQSVADYLKLENINWHFIPPRSPHFGGLWEAAVKSFKHHLCRVLGETLLSYEALLTCVAEIEAIMNSRPITPISSDPNDLTALTPGHFLIGDTITSLPEHDLTSIKAARLSSWQHAQQLRQHFWSRWYKEYLHELTVRKRWHSQQPTDLDIGTLVTLKEDNMPPMRWPLGRIVQLHPGRDGVTRVVTVKTATGEYKRSVKKLSPLPFDVDRCNDLPT